MDELPPGALDDWAEASAAAGLSPDAELAYLAEMKAISLALEARDRAGADRLAAERQQRRQGRQRHETDEVLLADGLDRLAGQRDVELANFDPDLADLADRRAALTPMQVYDEMMYQVTGTGNGLRPAAQRRQALPPVGDLAKRIGLVS